VDPGFECPSRHKANLFLTLIQNWQVGRGRQPLPAPPLPPDLVSRPVSNPAHASVS
jgi:hypothetical protein